MTNNDMLINEIAGHISAISSLLGLPVTESNKDTPKRVAKMYCNELFIHRNNEGIEDLKAKMKLFPNEKGNSQPISVTVPINSVCEHHWLPFMGDVTVIYIPDKQIIGLSKIPRVVKFFSKKPQLQERLTEEIGEFLVSTIQPKSLFVKVVASHTCVSMRGAESPCDTTTVYEYNK